MTPTNIILPVAGYGRRFQEAGYREEKPLIRAGGRTLLEWSIGCLAPRKLWGQVTLVARQHQMTAAFAWRAEDAGFKPDHVVHLAGPTQGAACTVLAAAVGLPSEEPVLVMNTDQWFRCDLEQVIAQAELEIWDGFILTFPGRGPAWSYAVTNGTNRIVHVIEKKEVSPFATCGVYWWRRTGDLIRSICAMIASGQRTNNEFYLAPSANFLPLADCDVRIVPVDEFHGLGTPEQVKEFEALLASGWKP